MTMNGHYVSPALVVVLAAMWLLLNQAVTPGTLALGLALAVLLAWFGSILRPLRTRLRRLDRAAALLFIVFWDVIRSNVNVARLVLGAARAVRPGFVRIPLDLKNDHGLAALACIVTSTPGTVWAGLSHDRETLTLHVLDLKDEGTWIRTIKQRYERRLMEIFP